jgi:carbon-monoxide dehydrogenase medium subunit
MTLPKFDYLAPTSIEEALDLLAELGDTARVMAGGTDLMIKMRKGLIHAKAVVGLKRIRGLDRISFDRKNGLHIGAMALLADVADHRDIRKYYPALADAAASTANVQIRNMGTVAGNLCNAAPSADNAPGLMVMGAEAVVMGKGGERRIPLDRFFLGPGLTALGPCEILTALSVPVPPLHSGAAYCPISARSKVDIAAAGVAVMVVMDGRTCTDGRVALGAVAPTPMRARRAEKSLRGQVLTEEVTHQAGLLAAKEARPISDMRAGAGYRRSMVEVLTRRAIAEAVKRAAK